LGLVHCALHWQWLAGMGDGEKHAGVGGHLALFAQGIGFGHQQIKVGIRPGGAAGD
jgi:hypothetical protein